MNLDRFDGYPDLQERRIKKPTVFERWQALGFDPAEAGEGSESTSSVTEGRQLPTSSGAPRHLPTSSVTLRVTPSPAGEGKTGKALPDVFIE